MSAELTGGVWVVGEQKEGNLRSVTMELVTAGRRIADALKQELTAIMVGHDLDRLSRVLFDFGPDNIILLSSGTTENIIPEVYAEQLRILITERKPAAVLFPATYDGRDVASRLAAKLGLGLAADCTELNVDEAGRFTQIRPAFGGNLMAVIHQPTARPQLATLRPQMVKPKRIENRKTPTIEHLELNRPNLSFSKSILKTVREVAEESGNLDEAEVIIGIGRGLGAKENLRLVNRLALAIHAAIGGSRGAIDAGWLPHNQQIGLTGRAVSPKMYIALGVSGAIQHLVGVRTAKEIVAINKDPEAPIFKAATFGIVGDIFTVVPALLKELEAPAQTVRT